MTPRATVTARTTVVAGLAAVAAAALLGLAPPTAAAPTDDTVVTSTTQSEAEPFEETPTDTTVVSDTGTTVAEIPDEPTVTAVPDDPGPSQTEARPSTAPQVRNSGIEASSIVLAVLVLAGIGGVSWILIRRPRRPHPGFIRSDAADDGPAPRPHPAAPSNRAVDTTTLDLLIDLGDALIDAGDAVSHVESTLRSLGNVYGISGLGVLVLPTALVVSVPGAADVKTEVSSARRRTLRLDQIDDIIHLVNAAERGDVSIEQGRAELARIRESDPPFGPSLVLMGYVLSTVGIALLLRAGWREVILAAVLGLGIGQFRRATQRFGVSYQPFWPLIAAAAVSTVVFSTAHLVDDLIVFPVLVAPLITFLPGALLTTAMLELATGQIVAGSARLASGAMQLLLLSLGIVAGGQLVGVPGGDLRASGSGIVAGMLPWIGVAAFGVGVVWFNGARRSALVWILVSLYAAYAGQVIGGLFFGSSLSAFFGAAAMTPVALLAARQRSGPTPLVTFLPGFWILVPGALGLEGVTRIVGADGTATGTGALATTVVSMVGISLGILLGLALVARDPDRPWSDAYAAATEDPHPTP